MKRTVIRRPVERVLEAARPPLQAGLYVDQAGFVCIGNVRVARLVERNGTRMLQFRDPCRPRAEKRGTPYVEVPIQEVAELAIAPGDLASEENGSTMGGGEGTPDDPKA